MKHLFLLGLGVIGFSVVGLGETPSSLTSIPLGDSTPDSSKQGWGTLQKDRAVSEAPLVIAGRTFSHGLGTHAPGEIVYLLDDDYESFTAWVGVDDHLKNHPDAGLASVVFQVIGDGKVLFDSGVMRLGDPSKEVKISLQGLTEMRLKVNDAGDGKSCDHANWAEPVLTKITTQTSPAATAHQIKAGDFILNLDADGAVVSAKIGTAEWPISGSTRLHGFRPDDTPVAMVSLPGQAYAFTRTLTNGKGQTCTVTDRFTPERGAIRWEVIMTSTDPTWTAPVSTGMQCRNPDDTLVWTAWGSPDFSGQQLSPELAALVQAGKASVGGDWSDPLNPVGFLRRSWHYGNISQNCPVGSDFIALPLFTLLSPRSDTGLSLVISPDNVLLNMDLSVTSTGQFRFTRKNHRFGGGQPLKFISHLVPHESSWRGGLRFMTERYPTYFEAPNPRAHQIAACGAYTLCEAPIEVEKFKKMAFGFNWKLSDDFPYMGMFIPPVKDMDEKWTRSGSEPAPKGQGPQTSCRQMNDYAKYMKQNGFSVLSYFNVTEFGKHLKPHTSPISPEKAASPELWKNGADYLQVKLPNAWFGVRGNCYGGIVVDPGDPDYQAFILEQAARNTKMLPDTDGICIDRADWLRYYNPKADDGFSWVNGKPARSLFLSWRDLMAKMGPQLHQADKVIFCNLMTMRLELSKELDGIYTEFGHNGNALNGSALLGLRKPVIAWTYNETLQQPNPDAFMQRHLHVGAFPTAPYPNNNHCINPEPVADQLYLDYGPLLGAMRGKKWVLAPRCVETTTVGTKVNLFEVPGGYALPVTYGGDSQTALVEVRNIPGLHKLKATALHPGVDASVHVASTWKDGVLTLTVPLKRGCAMLQLTETL